MDDDTATYVLDFRSTRNCDRIAGMSPGEEIDVLVRPDGLPALDPITATARRSADGSEVTVTVDRGCEPRTHRWMWWILEDALRVHRGKQ